MVLRRIGMSIHSAYTEKISMDLIVGNTKPILNCVDYCLGEEAEKIKQAAQSEAKKKRRKKKKDKVTKKKKEQQEKENKEKEQKDREEKVNFFKFRKCLYLIGTKRTRTNGSRTPKN